MACRSPSARAASGGGGVARRPALARRMACLRRGGSGGDGYADSCADKVQLRRRRGASVRGAVVSAQASANWRSGAATEGPSTTPIPSSRWRPCSLLSRFPARRSPALAPGDRQSFSRDQQGSPACSRVLARLRRPARPTGRPMRCSARPVTSSRIRACCTEQARFGGPSFRLEKLVSKKCCKKDSPARDVRGARSSPQSLRMLNSIKQRTIVVVANIAKSAAEAADDGNHPLHQGCCRTRGSPMKRLILAATLALAPLASPGVATRVAGKRSARFEGKPSRNPGAGGGQLQRPNLKLNAVPRWQGHRRRQSAKVHQLHLHAGGRPTRGVNEEMSALAGTLEEVSSLQKLIVTRCSSMAAPTFRSPARSSVRSPPGACPSGARRERRLLQVASMAPVPAATVVAPVIQFS